MPPKKTAPTKKEERVVSAADLKIACDKALPVLQNLVESLKAFDWSNQDELPDETVALHVPLCQLFNMLVGDKNKACEIIFAHERNMKVNPKKQGADLTDGLGSYEHKGPKWSKGERINICWPVPVKAGETDEYRRKALIASAEEKTHNGGAVFDIRDCKGNEVALYELSGAFFKEYLTRIPLPGCDKINLGCKRCTHCGEFHRLLRLVEFDERFRANNNSLTDNEWKEVFAPKVPTNCE